MRGGRRVRLKNALVNSATVKDRNALVKRANAGKSDGVNVRVTPRKRSRVAGKSSGHDQMVPFISRDRAAQSLNSPAPGGFLIASDEGSDLVDQACRQRRCVC